MWCGRALDGKLDSNTNGAVTGDLDVDHKVRVRVRVRVRRRPYSGPTDGYTLSVYGRPAWNGLTSVWYQKMLSSQTSTKAKSVTNTRHEVPRAVGLVGEQSDRGLAMETEKEKDKAIPIHELEDGVSVLCTLIKLGLGLD